LRQAQRRPEEDTPVSGEYRRSSAPNADALPTVRNLVPWREMERKLAERLAAKAAAGELTGELKDFRPQHSAAIEPSPEVSLRPLLEQEESGALSYKVYSLAELEARRHSAPVEIVEARETPLSFDEAVEWVRHAVRHDQKKLAIAVGIVFGALLAFFLVLLTVAELTDDLKPRRARVENVDAVPTSARAALPAVPVVAAAAPEADITLELDDPPPVATPRKATPKKKR
jgi:hypothetical protein